MGSYFSKKPQPKTKIDEIVDRILANPKVNMSAIPDKYERAMYVSLLTALSENLDEILGTIELKVIDKKITFKVEQIES